MAATAAEILLETFENIVISFRLETVFRIIAKMSDTLHEPCQFYHFYIFQYFNVNWWPASQYAELIIGDISQILVSLL